MMTRSSTLTLAWAALNLVGLAALVAPFVAFFYVESTPLGGMDVEGALLEVRTFALLVALLCLLCYVSIIRIEAHPRYKGLSFLSNPYLRLAVA